MSVYPIMVVAVLPGTGTSWHAGGTGTRDSVPGVLCGLSYSCCHGVPWRWGLWSRWGCEMTPEKGLCACPPEPLARWHLGSSLARWLTSSLPSAPSQGHKCLGQEGFGVLGPAARGELVSPQTGTGACAAVAGHCAVATFCEGLFLFPSFSTHGTCYPKWLPCPHTVEPCLLRPLPCPRVMGHGWLPAAGQQVWRSRGMEEPKLGQSGGDSMGWHGVAWLIMGSQPWGETEECKFLQAQGRMC